MTKTGKSVLHRTCLTAVNKADAGAAHHPKKKKAAKPLPSATRVRGSGRLVGTTCLQPLPPGHPATLNGHEDDSGEDDATVEFRARGKNYVWLHSWAGRW